jgi:hypothetical protein
MSIETVLSGACLSGGVDGILEKCALEATKCRSSLNFQSGHQLITGASDPAIGAPCLESISTVNIGRCARQVSGQLDELMCTNSADACAGNFTTPDLTCNILFDTAENKNSLYGACVQNGETTCVWSRQDCPEAQGATWLGASSNLGCDCSLVKVGACDYNGEYICAVSSEACDSEGSWISQSDLRNTVPLKDCRLCSEQDLAATGPPSPTPAPTPIPTTFPPVNPAGCSICGEGKLVTDPEAVFSYPGQLNVPCGDLQIAGHQGLIGPTQCATLPPLVSATCGCSSSSPAPAMVAPSGQQICHVCGQGKTVGNATALFTYNDQPPIECGDLEASGLEGQISPEECTTLLPAVADICLCQDESFPTAPVAAAPQMIPPVAPVAPTISPVSPPAISPVSPPTVSPVLPPPTPLPTQTVTFSPTPAPAPRPSSDGCSICGDGKVVINSELIFSFPGQVRGICCHRIFFQRQKVQSCPFPALRPVWSVAASWLARYDSSL